MNQELVSIGLPFYNSEKTIELAIKSVLAQTHQNWELILINDGSTDSSDEIVERFISRDQRIKYFKFHENLGLITRLNQVVDLSTSNFIARMDSDDLMMPTRIQKQLFVLNNDKSIDVVASGIFTIDDNNFPCGIRDISPISANLSNIINKKFLTHPTIMARKNWFNNNRYRNYPRAEDLELWIRTNHTSNFFRIEEPLYIYREGNVSISNYIKSNNTFIKIIWSHDMLELSFITKFYFILLTYLKSFVYLSLGIFKLQYLLVIKRNSSLDTYQEKFLVDTLNAIRNYESNVDKS